ncbi:glycosyltransferase family 4 protein [Haloterrigena sp. SYSU A121-1]|uniref:Glycosyltransferase family 4 protein n=1 Tax=Haloterrigena gelatinilytica TaxID=2741724 RepID=A0A8J8GKR4_9EURY|nr:glycosyltransferase family 4 protein [Haloterrigena gelatinilytica]NUB91823.1 glycosyltransferase family 4 protein [Haloterrigena gelatinilytica]
MKIAYISASNPIGSIGGAANTAGKWIDELRERGVEIDVICRGESDASRVVDGIEVTELAGFRPRDEIATRLADGEYDVALVQDLWADIALEAAAEHGVPTVLSLTTTHATEGVVAELSPTRFVANSRYTQQWITSVWGRDSTLVYPHIDFDFYTAPEGPSDRISMINPIDMKGGHTFRAVAERFPDRDFLAKGGWYGFRNDDFSWDVEALHLQGSTFHDAPSDVPEAEILERGPTDAEFDDLENVAFTSEPGILDVYAKTGVLLVPSVWAEAFGRVVLEAMWNGIPVVASHRGGLPEACGGAGLLVDEYTDSDAWAEAIEKLDDPDVYEGFAERGRERAEAYRDRLPEQIDALETVLAEAAAEG